ncbi:STAS domain-containing protein [Adhaeribacter rhizoryzae]|uniref:Anti-sigma factor antagonist n=1 Tax=Adhaeribacter rhizoryzae TaxID=2607907 RepID=A0A5M6DB18_9BACT|nr:STAS domain-containing protein [Adhaeribacter rhizoryzae]KAA5544758.1 STAS domain-containing protein [Adhaeribacter rhizoryzae]
MKIYTQKTGESYLVKLCGELDASNAEAVEKILDELIQLNPAQIQVDCKELEYISSRGLGVFISRFQEIQHKQIKFFCLICANKCCTFSGCLVWKI